MQLLCMLLRENRTPCMPLRENRIRCWALRENRLHVGVRGALSVWPRLLPYSMARVFENLVFEGLNFRKAGFVSPSKTNDPASINPKIRPLVLP